VIRATAGASTHVGQVRDGNEDSFVAVDGLYFVADGMGGHSAGEIASAIAVATLRELHENSDHPLDTAEAVVEAVATANRAIFAEALADPSKSGMGTTLTGIVVTRPESDQIVVANVGDSRTYLWRHGELRQVTKDHSHVQTLVDRGAITRAEARVHFQRNIVLRAMGIESWVDVDTFTVDVEDGDRYIICSDGLVDEADDDEIEREIRHSGGPQNLSERLVALANRNGGRDNVTVIVVDVQSADSPAPSPVPTPPASAPHTTAVAARSPSLRRSRARRFSVVAVVCTAVIVAVIVGVGVNARRGYFVRFESRSDDARLLIYRGSPESVLWFAPTIEADTTLRRSDLHPGLAEQLDDPRSFESAPRAAAFVNSIRDVVEEHTGQ